MDELFRNATTNHPFKTTGTGTSQAILNLLIESKIPYIGALTGGLFLRVPFYPNLINVRASYQDETAAMVEYLVNIKMLRRISIFYQNDAFGVSGLGTFLCVDSNDAVTLTTILSFNIDINIVYMLDVDILEMKQHESTFP